MAAYAALVSLMHTIQQIQHHPRPPISLHKTQVESLTEKITFLQEFLEGSSHIDYGNEADDLEMRIADAAYAAEDAIESHIVDQIHAGSRSQCKAISPADLYKLGLEKVMQDMDLIKKEVMEIKEKTGVDLMRRRPTPASAVRSSLTKRNVMVGFDDLLNEVMDKLTDGQSGRQIIPIVGMGGSGKTTLARNIYQSKYAVQHFDILVGVTISQVYKVRELFLELLSQAGGESESQMNESKLGERLHKRLSGRRYLIILDDIWDIEVWDQLKLYFPNNNNGSRIVLTTRLSNLAYEVTNSNVIKMGFLNEDNSWDLFKKIVLGEEGCPFELEEIGKEIVKNCEGLPLAIVVVGGLLAKTGRKQEDWERIGRNLSSALNSEDDESCLKILYMSYSQLPVWLKPCFLYMGIFPEDSLIRISTLVNLWVAEGFLKPIHGKSLEIVAKEYLNDLIDRNLVLADRLGSTGSIKYCSIHDLLRDFCLREAKRERLYVVAEQHTLPRCIKDKRRIVVHDSTPNETVHALKSSSLVRSLMWDFPNLLWGYNFRLLRILKAYDKYHRSSLCCVENVFKLVNSRYIAVSVNPYFKFDSSVCLPWNLQTLIVNTKRWGSIVLSKIWNMPQLRHVEFTRLYLPDPPNTSVGRRDIVVLENLCKLVGVINFKCGEEVVKRIPNIKNLKVRYENDFELGSLDHCLNNLERLHKLESFVCDFSEGGPNDSLRDITFPQSLKKLTVVANCTLNWDDIMAKIGSLPLLEKLRIFGGSFHGSKWETSEGQFRSLKFLEINECSGLVYWKTESTHFPRLEHLVLIKLSELEEIPSDIGEIPTLRSIKVRWCSYTAVNSAEEIAREQEELGNEDLQITVY